MTFEFRFILCALAVYRLAELLVLDDGPFEIFDRIRKFFGQQSAIITGPSVIKEIALLLSCPFCVAIWLSFIGVFFVFLPSLPGDVFLVIFALAGVQAFLEQFSNSR